jgi:hypothetical protein
MSPKQVVVSETNRTPIVQIITWLALVASALAFLAHASLKLYVSRSLSLEIAAGIFALVRKMALISEHFIVTYIPDPLRCAIASRLSSGCKWLRETPGLFTGGDHSISIQGTK